VLSTLPIPLGRTLLVLGAGATRASTLSVPTDRPDPPLDRDFFTQIQRIKHEKHTPFVAALIRFCFDEFGPGWSLTMEQFFNYIWYVERFRGALFIDVELPKERKLLRVSDVFRQVLLASLEDSLFGEHSQDCRQSRCARHDLLAEHAEAADTFVSFNYDCLIDASLSTSCPYWNAATSYGFKPLKPKGASYWARRNVAVDQEVRLLKLHGSINWRETSKGISLKSRPYTRQSGTLIHFSIVPPVMNKDGELLGGHLEAVWENAFDRLCAAESVIIIGYSLPTADVLANALFAARSSLGLPLKYLVIANPSRETGHHLLRVFRKSLDPSSRVLNFDSFERMADYLFSGDRELI